MSADGRALYGILGYPAAHSLSPLMHQAAFDRLAMHAQYRIFEVRPSELESFLRDTARLTLRGFNITIPYKEKVIPLLDYVSSDARGIGAVNTVKVHAGRLEGFNTDAQGFLDDLAAKGLSLSSARVCVIGAGGAGRAVCFALASAGCAEISLYNRDSRKAGHLIEQLAGQFPKTVFRQAESVDRLEMDEAVLLVNATSVGMKEDDPQLVEERLLHKNLFVYDLVYAPLETKLLRLAAEKGCRCANGLGMLLRQGMLAFEIWTGVKPPQDAMEQALAKAVKNYGDVP